MPASFYVVVSLLFAVFLFSCDRRDYAPKPKAYSRIKFPEKRYLTYKGSCPFQFSYPVYSQVVPDSSSFAQPCWFDLVYPQFNARLHVSYYPVSNKEMFNKLVEDAHTFAFKHTIKATAIDEARIHYPVHSVYGLFYTIEGNSASNTQFYITDSTEHYLRGALYFDERPQFDSIQPVVAFINEDLAHMIKSLKWAK